MPDPAARQMPESSTTRDEDDGEVCVDGYPEHDWKVMDERDGIRTLSCRRCGAESQEDCDA